MTTLAIFYSVAPILTAAPVHAPAPAPHLDVLMFSGFMISILTLLIWGYQGESRSCTLALGICQLALAIYGVLQGAWPLAMVTIVFSAATIWRWHQAKDIARHVISKERLKIMGLQKYWENEPGVNQMFGPN